MRTVSRRQPTSRSSSLARACGRPIRTPPAPTSSSTCRRARTRSAPSSATIRRQHHGDQGGLQPRGTHGKVVFRGRGRVKGIPTTTTASRRWGPRSASARILSSSACSVHRKPELSPSFEVNGVKVALPPARRTVGFEFKQRNRIINNDVSSGTFTFTNIFVGDVLVEAANYFSPDIVSADATIPTPDATVAVTLSPIDGRRDRCGLRTGRHHPSRRRCNRYPRFWNGQRRGRGDRRHGSFRVPPAACRQVRDQRVDHENGLVSMVISSQVGVGQSVEVPLRLLRRGSVSVTVTGSKGLVEGASVILQNIDFPGNGGKG